MFTIIGGDGKEYGPATVEQLRSWIAAGRANLDTKAKALGSEEWRRLGDYAEFSSPTGAPPVMSSVPPPATPGVMPVVTTATPQLAGYGARFGAALIDGILVMLCRIPASLAIMKVVIEQVQSGQQPSVATLISLASEAMMKAIPFLVALAVVQGVLLSTRGQSLGKLMVGTRIVRHSDGTRVGFLHAFLLRGAIPWVIQQIPLLGGLFWIVDVCFIFGEQRRCVHDYIAGTKVVNA